MKPFENFNWGNFWEDSDYATEEYVGKKPTDEEVSDIEKELGYKLPQSYIELIGNHNGGIPRYNIFWDDNVCVNITGIYGIDKSKRCSVCGEFGNELWLNEWGYPDIGVAIADTISGGHDMIFLDYSECGANGEPKVTLIDQEDDYESYTLADTFEEFIAGLTTDDAEMDESEFKQLGEDEQLATMRKIQHLCGYEPMVRLLNNVGSENLSDQLLGELAKAYNNTGREREAIKVLELVEEENRDAMWYCRCGFSHGMLSQKTDYAPTTEVQDALEMLEKSIEMAEKAENDNAITWCIEIIENILNISPEELKHKYPFIGRHYLSGSQSKTVDEDPTTQLQKKIYREFTADDLKNIDGIWEVSEPLMWVIEVFGSYDEYLNSVEPFALEQRYLNAIIWYFSDVGTGGHRKFLASSTGMLWKDALEGLKLFHMSDHAENLQELVDFLGGSISFDRRERDDLIDQFGDDVSFDTVLCRLDNFVNQHEWEEPLTRYIRTNPDQFIFQWYYYE